VIRFAPLPLEDRKIMHEQFQGMVDYLRAETGLSIEMVYLSDYADIIEHFRHNQIDLAYLGPLPYVILKKQFSAAEPLVCFRDVSGAASYSCSLVAYGDSDLKIDSLKGKHFGLTQPYSTCGYLAVSEILGQAGRSLERDGNSYQYAGSHSKAALGVAQGEFDVAGVKTAIAKRYLHLDLHIIGESRRYPGFTLVANSNKLNPASQAKLKQALLALQPISHPQDRVRVSTWGAHLRQGAVEPSQCDYQAVAEALQRAPSLITGARP
jgi:phosphonate transport system substrate-binding protein